MVECARHVNLVKAPTEIADSETQLALVLSDCDYKQQALLKQLVSILEADKFARLATTAVSVEVRVVGAPPSSQWSVISQCPHEPIKRRLNTNKAAARFRKTLAAVKWVSAMCSLRLFVQQQSLAISSPSPPGAQVDPLVS